MSAPQMPFPGATNGPAPVFVLQPPEVPQPTLLDEEIATHDWPMPHTHPFKPTASKPAGLFARIREALS